MTKHIANFCLFGSADGFDITEVEVIKETEQSVTVWIPCGGGNRYKRTMRKESSSEGAYNTRHEAVAAIVAYNQKEHDSAKAVLEYRAERLSNAVRLAAMEPQS